MNNLQHRGAPDQMPHYVTSDLGLHFLPIPLPGSFTICSLLTDIYYACIYLFLNHDSIKGHDRNIKNLLFDMHKLILILDTDKSNN